MTAGLTAFVIASPFYLRNWLLLGSPIYPPPEGLLGVFHPKYLSAGMIHNLQSYVLRHGNGFGNGLTAYLLLPFSLTYHTSNFNGAGGIGLAPLGLGFLGVWAASRNRFSSFLALLGWMFTTLWFLTVRESRYLLHVYVIGAVFAVLGWRWVLATTSSMSKRLSALIIAVSLSYGLCMMGRTWKNDLRAVFSSSYARQARQESVPFWQSFDYLNHNPDVTRVLILDASVTPYYSDKNYIKPFGMWGERVLPGVSQATDVLPMLRELGVSHILDVHSTISGFQVPKGITNLTLVFELPNQRIYRVNP
jgi:hypothetical protein